MYAFVINHFGCNSLYLKNEILFLISFVHRTRHDIVYLYSVNDTPKEYIDVIKALQLNIKIHSYDDRNITFNVVNDSHYKHFNMLRTCNYIFAYNLIEYEKICIIESDMIVVDEIDSIFNFNCPSIVYYPLNNKNINSNMEIVLNKNERKSLISRCDKESFTNGGVILLKPSLNTFEKLKNNIPFVIKNKCIYPSETVFLYTVEKFYNLPIRYNTSHFFVNIDKYKSNKSIKILHFNNTKYKPLYILKDTTYDINTIKNLEKRKILQDYKTKYYKKYIKLINKLIKVLNKKIVT
jgi:alpha-N-acetylglucosamine transferase